MRVRDERLTGFAKSMRRMPTEAEARFWLYAQNRGINGLKFRRQVPVSDYIVDFICPEHKLIVEIDGGQHAADGADLARDAVLEAGGYRVLRFWNHDVLTDMDAVAATILAQVAKR